MRIRKQSEKTQGKIRLSLSITVQVLNIQTEEVLIYNYKLTAAKTIGTSNYYLGVISGFSCIIKYLSINNFLDII